MKRRQAAKLSARSHGLRRQAGERGKLTFEPSALRRILQEPLERGRELRLGLRTRVGFEHAELGLHDLAERPERDADPVGETAATAPRDDLVVVVDDCVELSDQAALPDAGNAGNR